MHPKRRNRETDFTGVPFYRFENISYNLSADNSFRSSSIILPRVNSEALFQEDLHPLIPLPSTAHRIDDIKSGSVSPLFSDFKEVRTFHEGKVLPYDQNGLPYSNIKGKLPVHSADKRSSTARNSTASPNSKVEKEDDALEYPIQLEIPSWFNSKWETAHLKILKTGLYVFKDQQDPKPIHEVPFANLDKVSKLDEIVSIEERNKKLNMKLRNVDESRICHDQLSKLRSTSRLPVQGSQGVLTGAAKMLRAPKNNLESVMLVLTSKAVLNVYNGELKQINFTKPPNKTISLDECIHMGLKNVKEGCELILRFNDETFLFQMKSVDEARTWVLTIQSLFGTNMKYIKRDADIPTFEGAATIVETSVPALKSQESKEVTICLVDANVLVYANYTDQKPLAILERSKLDDPSYLSFKAVDSPFSVRLSLREGTFVSLKLKDSIEIASWEREVRLIWMAAHNLVKYLNIDPTLNNFSHPPLAIPNYSEIKADNAKLENYASFICVAPVGAANFGVSFIPISATLIRPEYSYVFDRGPFIQKMLDY